MNNEGPNSRIESQVDTRKKHDIENTTESSRRSVEKQVISDLTKDTSLEIKTTNWNKNGTNLIKGYMILLRQQMPRKPQNITLLCKLIKL